MVDVDPGVNRRQVPSPYQAGKIMGAEPGLMYLTPTDHTGLVKKDRVQGRMHLASVDVTSG